MPMIKRILIIGESELFCLGFTAAFADREVSIITTTDLSEGIRHVVVHGPDLLVYDPFAHDIEGRTYLLKLRQRFPNLPILVVTGCDNPVDIQHILQQRVSGYILKTASVADLVAAIDAITSGRTYFHPDVTHALFNHGNMTQPTDGGLTARQKQVLKLVAEGRTAKQIASILGVTQKTVESHRVALMTRLGIHNVVGLVRYAILNGYINLDENTSVRPKKVAC